MHIEIYMHVFIDTKNYNALQRLNVVHVTHEIDATYIPLKLTASSLPSSRTKSQANVHPVCLHARTSLSKRAETCTWCTATQPSSGVISFHLYLCWSPSPFCSCWGESSLHPAPRESPNCASACRGLPKPGAALPAVQDARGLRAAFWPTATLKRRVREEAEAERGLAAPPGSLIPRSWGGDCGWRGGGGAPTASSPPLAAAGPPTDASLEPTFLSSQPGLAEGVGRPPVIL